MINEYTRFADILVNDVLTKLEGSHKNFERFESINKPSRKVILGSLSNTIKSKSKSAINNSSLSIKFLLKDIIDKIDIIPTFSVFYKVFPTYEEQKTQFNKYDEEQDEYDIVSIWKRKEFECESISLSEDISEYELDLTEIINDIELDETKFTAPNNSTIKYCKDKKSYKDELNLLKKTDSPKYDWRAKIYLNKNKLKQEGEELNLIEIGLVNITEENKKYETFLFDCKLKITLNENKLTPFIYSYEHNDEIKSYSSDLRTLNCHAKIEDNVIKTSHYAQHKDPKKDPKTNVDGFSMKFESLASEKCIDKLIKLYELMEEFESDCTSSNDNDLKDFKITKNNYLNGIKCLKTNPNALKAFQLMNKSFYMNLKSKYESWRLFQIVFIVSLIPEIVDKTCQRDICDLLHVMTGGGKSESYFGVVIFAAFYDRLTGKEFGVTALTKFPLRMLSIQQLQRVSNLFIWAEEIRKEENIKGNPFTVAYFVGNQNVDFPKDNVDILEEIRQSETPILGKIIDKCPICGNKVYLEEDEIRNLIIHKCSECERKFGLFYTDYEIYRVLPTLIISTVDKLASISQQYRIKNIFGGKIDKCSEGHGFIARNSNCVIKGCLGENIPIEVPFNTGPSIIIQDEMHLVKEGFGTIDSHFESLIERLSLEFSGEHFKNIAMSATLNGAEKQIKELYNKKLRIFPPTLKNKENNEFFFERKIDEGEYVYNRQIIGLKPNYVDNNTAIILSITYVSEFIKSVQENHNFADKYSFDESELKKIINSFKSMLSYHLKVSDVHNTKNFVGRNINDSDLDLYKIDSMTLTGDNSLDDIKEVIKQSEEFEEYDKLQITSATNIVSHGVDIDKWNLMFFQGIPRSTSEYIQALSRVGRKYHGIIFLWFYPNRVRDNSFYQNFNEYHKILEDKVEKVPIARWTKLGLKQTITSVFNASILCYLSNELEKPIYNLKEVNEVLSDERNRELIINFINNAYLSNSDEIGAEYFRENIEKHIDERIEYLHEYERDEKQLYKVLEDSPYRYFKTQTGMRGIQDTVNIKRNLPISYKK